MEMDSENEIRDRHAVACVISEISYQKYLQICALSDMDWVSERKYYILRNEYNLNMAELARETIEAAIESILAKGDPVVISIDTRWSSRGYHANESTTTMQGRPQRHLKALAPRQSSRISSHMVCRSPTLFTMKIRAARTSSRQPIRTPWSSSTSITVSATSRRTCWH